MSELNIVQSTFDEFCKSSNAAKKSGSWYRRSEETIFVLNLQKSNYAVRYFINVALWLLALGENDAPKENKCHVRTRLDDLVGASGEGQLAALLDMGSSIDDATRHDELLAVLREHLLPLMDAGSTVAGLRTGSGQRLIERALVTGPAQRLLQNQPT